MENRIVDWLFETDAVRVCPEGQPFWYASGKLGPLYINTHFLFGDEAQANMLLDAIEAETARDPAGLPGAIGALVMAQVQSDPRYAALMARVVEAAKGIEFDCVSGGERRDFFFSLAAAQMLGKPHLSIFKNLSCVYTTAQGESRLVGQDALRGQRMLHIVDLVTEASSYVRAWIPAVTSVGARIVASIAVIDRDQGGREVLAEAGIPLHALVKVSGSLFADAQAKGLLTGAQCEMVRGFLADPDAFVRSFLRAHPGYLQEQIALGGKAKERAERCIALGFGGADGN